MAIRYEDGNGNDLGTLQNAIAFEFSSTNGIISLGLQRQLANCLMDLFGRKPPKLDELEAFFQDTSVRVYDDTVAGSRISSATTTGKK